MTTIAFDGLMLASDSQITGRYASHSSTKIFESIDVVYCGSGDVAEYLTVIKMLCRGVADRDLKPEFESLHGNSRQFSVVRFCKRTRQFTLYDGCFYGIPIDEPFWAIGSGTQFAMGAMAAGANAAKAVEIASRFDIYTDAKIEAFPLLGEHGEVTNMGFAPVGLLFPEEPCLRGTMVSLGGVEVAN